MVTKVRGSVAEDYPIYVGSVAESFSGLSPSEGVLYRAVAWHEKSGAYAFADPTTRGGGFFVYDGARLKSEHDGVTVFSPTVLAVSAQAGASLRERTAAYGSGTGETDPGGSGVFVRLSEKDHLTFHDAGVLESFDDCTARVNAAIVAAVNGNGKLYADEGTYNFTGSGGGSITEGIKLPAGTLTQGIEIYGAGIGKTVLHQDSTLRLLLSVNANSTEAGPNPDTDNSRNIKIHDMTLEAEVATAGFSEQHHLASLSAVSNCEIFRVEFKGYRGDGLYLGSSQIGGTERHNVDVFVHHCIFDGVNKDNRNGISVIDGDNVEIFSNQFLNSTRADMPGPVDIEPNGGSTPVVKNIFVYNNRFSNCGGTSGCVGFFLKDAYTYTVNPESFYVFDNIMEDDNTAGSSVYFRAFNTTPALVTDATHDFNIVITGNTLHKNVVVLGVKGFDVSDNSLYTTGSATISLGSNTKTNEDNILSGRFLRNRIEVSSVGGAAGILLIGQAAEVDVSENTFKQNNGAVSYSVTLYGNVVTTTSANIKIANNTFDGAATVEIHLSSHTNDVGSTFIAGNKRIGGGSARISSALAFTNFVQTELVSVYDTTKLPDSFQIGESISVVNGDTGAPDSFNQGTLRTSKASSTAGFRKFVTQWYYPANNGATTLANVYFRKGLEGSNAWSAWKVLTGT